MGQQSLRRALAAGLVTAILAAPMSSVAQDATVVADLVVVAPASGPAWWKVSKGDASVWIMGLPLNTPEELTWDQSTLKRRLKGARLFVGVYNESAKFDKGRAVPDIPLELKEEFAKVSTQLGGGRNRSSFGMTADQFSPMPGSSSDRGASMLNQSVQRGAMQTGGAVNGRSVLDFLDLRFRKALVKQLCFCTLKEVNEVVRRARVPRVTPPVHTYSWNAAALGPDNPGADRCLRAILTEASTPRQRYEVSAALWAKGDVRGMLATEPPNISSACEYVWPGSTERTIAFQTSMIAQAMDRPGKVVAAARISHLVAKGGILERLRDQGFTIADPSKPLEE